MNHLTVLLYYFSKERFSEILTHFEIDHTSNETRASLINQLIASENFREDILLDFLYKLELQNFCKTAYISNSSGNKKEIWERIILFLKDIEPDSIRISKNEQHNEVTIVINNKEERMRDSSEIFKYNALLIAHRLVDY
ncbi:MAG: hypothetical protein ACTSUP_06125 [Candidatus Heimdallarchaeaceae archaeon]